MVFTNVYVFLKNDLETMEWKKNYIKYSPNKNKNIFKIMK